LDFLIERDDEIVHWETYDIAPYDGVLDGVIVPASAFGGCTRGFYTLAVRLKDGTQDTFDGNPRPLFDGTLREIWIKDGGNDFEVLAGTKRHTCQTTETPST
jgi:hypothetical protein